MLQAVRLPEELSTRLNLLAETTQRSKSFYIREALARFMDDMEDLYLAESRYAESMKSGAKSHTLDEVEQILGLAEHGLAA